MPPVTSAAPNTAAQSGGPVTASGSSTLSAASTSPTASAAPADTTIAGQIAKDSQTKADPNAPTATEQQVEELQSKMAKLNPELTFVLEKGSNRAVIQLMDRTTKEVIQQFPSEAAIQISRELDRYANGKLVNKVA